MSLLQILPNDLLDELSHKLQPIEMYNLGKNFNIKRYLGDGFWRLWVLQNMILRHDRDVIELSDDPDVWMHYALTMHVPYGNVLYNSAAKISNNNLIHMVPVYIISDDTLILSPRHNMTSVITWDPSNNKRDILIFNATTINKPYNQSDDIASNTYDKNITIDFDTYKGSHDEYPVKLMSGVVVSSKGRI